MISQIKSSNIISGAIGYDCEICLTKSISNNEIVLDKSQVNKNTDLDENEGNKSVHPASNGNTAANSSEYKTENYAKKAPICSFLVRGTCRHGSSGKKIVNDKVCQFSHLRKCKYFCKYGSDTIRGCTNRHCKFLHPFLCNSAIEFGECSNPSCTYYHLVDTTRNWYNSRNKDRGQKKLFVNTQNFGRNSGIRQNNVIRSGYPQNFQSYKNSKQYKNDFPEVNQSFTEIISCIKDLQVQNESIKTQLGLMESKFLSKSQENCGQYQEMVGTDQNFNVAYQKSHLQNQIYGCNSQNYQKNYEQNLQSQQH